MGGMRWLTEILGNIWTMAVEAGPWLLVGFTAAAVVRALVPTRIVASWLGRSGVGGVLRASVVGIPLPLCSCGVLPTAIGLRRQGASRPSTVSFLVSTPEIGFDSFLLSYALLGPVMAIARPISAFVSAVVAGFAAMAVSGADEPVETAPEPCDTGCCSSNTDAIQTDTQPTLVSRVTEGFVYVFTKLLGDISKWLVIAIIAAGVMNTFIDPSALERFGSGLPAMLVMLVVGVPLYLCATASTPIAAALLLAGVSPGTVLVLLLAGPATNIGSIGLLRKELGGRVVAAYLAAIAVCSIGMGLALDAVVGAFDDMMVTPTSAGHERHLFPHGFAVAATVLLIVLGLRGPAMRLIRSRTRQPESCGCGSEQAAPDRAAGFRV